MTPLKFPVKYHFAAEEFSMDLFQCPDSVLHRRHHVVIQQEIGAIQTEVMRAGGVTPRNRQRIGVVMRDWMRIHILMLDRKLAQFLVQNPLPSGAFRMPGVQTLRDSGVALDEYSLDNVRLVRSPGEISISEIKAKSRFRPRAA